MIAFIIPFDPTKNQIDLENIHLAETVSTNKESEGLHDKLNKVCEDHPGICFAIAIAQFRGFGFVKTQVTRTNF